MSEQSTSDQIDRPARGWLLLRCPEFGRMWLGNGFSALGTHLSVLALPLLILSTTGSATIAGLVATARLLAYLAANLPAGALADRLPRRATLLVADAVRGALMLTIGVSVASGHILPSAILIGLGAADTAVSAVAGPAGLAATRHLVRSEDITTALSLDTACGFGLRMAGPMVGGILFQVAPALPFLADAFTYAVSFLVILTVRRGLGGGSAQSTTLVRDIGTGLRVVVGTRFILLFMVWAALVNFASAGLSFGLVLVIGADHSGQLGGAMTIIALAGIVGAAIAPRVKGVGADTLVRTVTALTVALGVAMTVQPTRVVVTACVAGMCLLGPVATIPMNGRLFALVPDHMMGRVQSSIYLIGGSLTPFATLASGALAEHSSLVTAFATLTGVLAAVLGLVLLPVLRLAGPASAATPAALGTEPVGATAG